MGQRTRRDDPFIITQPLRAATGEDDRTKVGEVVPPLQSRGPEGAVELLSNVLVTIDPVQPTTREGRSVRGLPLAHLVQAELAAGSGLEVRFLPRIPAARSYRRSKRETLSCGEVT